MRSKLVCKSCGKEVFTVVQKRSYGDPNGPRFEYRYEFKCVHCGTKSTTHYMDEIELENWVELES